MTPMTPEQLLRIISAIETDRAAPYTTALDRMGQYIDLAHTVASTLAAEIVTYRELVAAAQAAIDSDDADESGTKAARDLAESMIGNGDDLILADLAKLGTGDAGER